MSPKVFIPRSFMKRLVGGWREANPLPDSSTQSSASVRRAVDTIARGGIHTYRARLPFQIPDQHGFKYPEDHAEFSVLGYYAVLEGIPPDYVLEIRGIPSESEAHSVLKRCYSGLMWSSIEWGVGVHIPSVKAQEVIYPDDPIAAAKKMYGEHGLDIPRVDAIIDTRLPCIVEENIAVRGITGGQMSIRLDHHIDEFFSLVDAGASKDTYSKIADNEKLKLALDVYTLSHFESSDAAKYIARISVLEILAPIVSASDSVLGVIEDFLEKLENILKTESDQVKRSEFLGLKNRLGNLKTTSHRSRIRYFVEKAYGALGFPDDEVKVNGKLAQDLYDLRGRLVHDGEAILGSSSSKLDKIVRDVLKSMF